MLNLDKSPFLKNAGAVKKEEILQQKRKAAQASRAARVRQYEAAAAKEMLEADEMDFSESRRRRLAQMKAEAAEQNK